MKKIITFLFISTFFADFPTLAQTRFITNYTTSDGLIQNTVRAFTQDSINRLWIGTAEGVSIFDGRDFSNYPPLNNLKNPVINCFYKIGKDTILAGTDGAGIAIFSARKYEPDSVAGYRIGRKYLISNYVYYMLKDDEGHFWICTDSGITKWKNINVLTEKKIHNGDVEHFSYREKNIGLSITNAVEEKDRSIWFGSSKGLTEYKNGRLVHYTSKKGFPEISVSTLYLDKSSKLWIGTVKGLYLYENGTFSNFSIKNKIPPLKINAILLDKNNILWLGTNKGLYYYANKKIKRFKLGNQYGANLVLSLFEDNEENIWVGTIHGVVKLEPSNFNLLHGSSKLNYIHKFFTDKNNVLWVLSSNGLYTIKRDQLVPFSKINRLPTRNIRAVLFNNSNPVWIGTDKGLFEFKNDYIKKFTINEGLKNNSIVSLTDIGQNILLVGTDEGLSVIPKNKKAKKEILNRYRSIYSGLPKGPARSVLVDHKNNIWIGFLYSGLFEIKGDSVINFMYRNNFNASNIRSIYEDSKNNLWIGTRYNGIYIYLNGHFKNLRSKDGLGSNWVSATVEDYKHNYWFGTARGITRLEGKLWRTFDTNDGAVSGEVTTETVGSDGKIWFGSYLGILKYINSNYNSEDLELTIYIKKATVNGNPNRFSSSPSPAILPYYMNNISIEYAGVWFRNESEVYYKYRLAGEDDTWSNQIKNNEIHYRNLAPGNYTFEVMAKNSEGIWSKSPAKISFVIMKPFWERWWFITVSLIFLIILISSITTIINKYRVNQVLKVARLREEISTNLHDDIGTSLTRIAIFSQLAKREMQGNSHKTTELLNRIEQSSRGLIDAMSDIVWSINPDNNSLDDAILHLEDFAVELLETRGIAMHIVIPEDIRKIGLALEVRRNLILIFKEMINNVIKHSQASKVDIKISFDVSRNKNGIRLSLKDDGVGFDVSKTTTGNGLKNIPRRIKYLGGDFSIDSKPGEGTNLNIFIPTS